MISMPQSRTTRTNGQNSWWGDDIGMPSPLPHPCALCWCLIGIKCSLTWEYRHKTEQYVPFLLVSVPILLYTSSQFNMTGQQAHIATLIVWVCTAAEKMHHKEPNGLVGPSQMWVSLAPDQQKGSTSSARSITARKKKEHT